MKHNHPEGISGYLCAACDAEDEQRATQQARRMRYRALEAKLGGLFPAPGSRCHGALLDLVDGERPSWYGLDRAETAIADAILAALELGRLT